jgi:Ran GTPase-activating protein (RanGAP) involved in mRNA processing and transport
MVVGSSTTVQSLDLSGNYLSEDAGRLLRDSVQGNRTLTSLDLRQNQISVDTTAAIDEACKLNKQKAQALRRDLFEAQASAQFANR